MDMVTRKVLHPAHQSLFTISGIHLSASPKRSSSWMGCGLPAWDGIQTWAYGFIGRHANYYTVEVMAREISVVFASIRIVDDSVVDGEVALQHFSFSDNRRGSCWTKVKDGRCENNLPKLTLKSECCCTIGKAWGSPCEICKPEDCDCRIGFAKVCSCIYLFIILWLIKWDICSSI